MKKAITLMVGILILLAITSSAYALPTVVYKDLPENHYGRYYIGTDNVVISNTIPEDMIEWVYTHEVTHWFYIQKMSDLQRRFWHRAFERDNHLPTEYCENTKRNKSEECFAESMTLAILHNEFPPENTTTYRVIKRAYDNLTELLNE